MARPIYETQAYASLVNSQPHNSAAFVHNVQGLDSSLHLQSEAVVHGTIDHRCLGLMFVEIRTSRRQ